MSVVLDAGAPQLSSWGAPSSEAPRRAREVVDHGIERAFRGDRAARRTLGQRLLPVIQRAVARRLAPLARACRRDPSLDRDDFVHGVWVQLFERDWRVLRAFDPARGSLEGYVATVADRHVLGVFRTKSKDPYCEIPTLATGLDALRLGSEGPELQTAARRELTQLHAFLQARLDARGLLLFHMLEVDGLTVCEVCERAEMSRDALYQWRRRLRVMIRQWRVELDAHAGGQTR